MNTNKDNMNHDESRQLDGKNNKRLRCATPVNNGYTAPILSDDSKYPETNVTIPSLDNVLDAKEWVDNGSRT